MNLNPAIKSSVCLVYAGVDSGLRLTLNVEQYEYMAGPHDAAGVKILLHEPRETPSVHGLGQAVATGTHAFVGVKFMMVRILLNNGAENALTNMR